MLSWAATLTSKLPRPRYGVSARRIRSCTSRLKSFSRLAILPSGPGRRRRPTEQGPVGADHRDPVGLHAGDRRGDELADRLGAAAVVGGLGAHHHGGGGRLLVAPERAALGQHDVDARGAHALHALDRAGDLALEGADPGHLLHERGHAERAEVVEQLVARLRALRQALLGEQHPGLGGIAVGHQHRGAVGADVEADARILEHAADAGDVLAREPYRASPAPGGSGSRLRGPPPGTPRGRSARAPRGGAARARRCCSTASRLARDRTSLFANPVPAQATLPDRSVTRLPCAEVAGRHAGAGQAPTRGHPTRRGGPAGFW